MKRLVLAMLLVPFLSVAQAPPEVIVDPLAVCKEGKCTMSEKDYITLRQFHQERMAALIDAGEAIAALQQHNAELTQLLGRVAARRCGSRV